MNGNFRKTQLENGLRILSEQMEGVQSVSLGVWIGVGARHDPANQLGLSHLLEHMAFKGTTHRSAYEIAVSLEALGGHLNAFTEKEFTCYWAVVLDRDLKQAVDVLADIVQAALLSDSDLKNEKRIILEEIRNLEDTPEDFLHEYFLRTIFSDHPLGNPILGTFTSVKTIQQSDLISHREKHYAFPNTLITAAGRVDHEKLVQYVANAFINLNPHYTEGKFSPIAKKSIRRPQRHAFLSQTHFCTGMRVYPYKDDRKFPLILLDTYFGGGMSSRLFQTLRENLGLAYNVYSFLDFWSDTGVFGVYVCTSPKFAEHAMEVLEKEYKRLLTDGISKEDLERIKSQVIGNWTLTFEDPTSRMTRLAKMEAYTQSYVSLDEVIDRIKAVSKDQICEIAEDVLQKQKRYTVVLTPEQMYSTSCLKTA